MNRKLIILTVLFSAISASFGEYKLQSKLISPDSTNLDNYGRCVSIDENTAIICADNPSDSNSLIYVYKLNGLDWEYEDSLILPNPQTSFELGETDRACIIGDIIVAGSPGYSSTKGAVYVFKRQSGQWGNAEIITASDSVNGDMFGWAVAFDGDKIVAGAPYNNDHKGAAYVFSYNGTNWIQDQKLIASDGETRYDRNQSVYGDRFGMAVAVDGNNIVIGDQWDQCSGNYNQFYGSAYLFKYNESSWLEEEKFEASLGEYTDNFGVSVSVSGETVVVGAWKQDAVNDGSKSAGAIYVYEPNSGNWDETILRDPCNLDDTAYLGYDVEINSNKIVAGAFRDADNGTRAGAALVYERIGGSWTNGQRLAENIASMYDYFGYSVAIDNDNVLIGAPVYSSLDSSPGQAYIFHNDIRTPPMYVVTKLSNNTSAYPSCINDNGEVVGVTGSSNHFDSFIWKNGVFQYLYKPEDGESMIAREINNSGQIVGELLMPYYYDYAIRGFLMKDGEIIYMPKENHVYTSTYGINNTGYMVGQLKDHSNTLRGYTWDPCTFDSNCLTNFSGVGLGKAYSINDYNQSVGYYRLSFGPSHAFVYDAINGFKDIGVLPGKTHSYAYYINNNSKVVGYSHSDFEDYRAFIYYVDSNEMTNLGTLDGSIASFALEISDNDIVVGWCERADESEKGCMWIDEQIYDFNDYVIDSKWAITRAISINDNGQIVGKGIYNGIEYAVLLSPVGRLDNDSDVDFVDMTVFSANWQKTDCNDINNWCSNSDINRDGNVDEIDLVNLCQQWLNGVE